MIAWINIGVFFVSALLFLIFYNLSVSPAALEKRMGPGAYPRCARYRVVAMIFEMITLVNYVIYIFYPLPIPLPKTFSWPYWVSALIAIAIAIPSVWLMVRGMLDAGVETAVPRKEHTLYGGLYEKVRHPQAAGEVFLWWVLAFLLNSPFLALLSFVWLPIFYWICVAEEKDLVLRYGEPYVVYRERTGMFWPKL